MKIRVFLTEKQQKLYKKIGANPEVVLTWLNRELVKLLEKSEDIYGELNKLDEELLVDALLEGMEVKHRERLEQEKINRAMKKERKRKQERMGYIKRKHLDDVSQGSV